MPEFLGLAEERRSRGLSLEAVAQATKISIYFLRAIEEERFQDLPGGIYNTSYIRQYAGYTGANELAILERYTAFIDSTNVAALPQPIGTSRFSFAVWRLFQMIRREPQGTKAQPERPVTDAG